MSGDATRQVSSARQSHQENTWLARRADIDQLPPRIAAKVWPEPNSGCWLWSAATDPRGYGRLRVGNTRTGRTMVWAHRVVWELLVGPIGAGLQIDHLCRNPACVNPAHLEPVTPQVNTLRGNSLSAIRARRTHCPRGHEYDCRYGRVGRSSRGCLRCHAATESARRARNRAAAAQGAA